MWNGFSIRSTEFERGACNGLFSDVTNSCFEMIKLQYIAYFKVKIFFL